ARKAAALGISRRELLGGAAAAAVTFALPSAARAGGSTPRIAIIGAGVSGLNCALALSDAGYASTVYESSGRIGGRMYSNTTGYWTDGQISEWGGELVDTRHKTIFSLAQRFNIPMDDVIGASPQGAEDTYYFLGSYYPKKQANIDFQNVWQAIK